MYFHLTQKDPTTGVCRVVNIIVVDDMEAFAVNAANYLAQFDHVLPKDREHQPGDPGIGWIYDDVEQVFIAPKSADQMDSSVSAADLENVPPNGVISWTTAEGAKSARRIDAGIWLTQASETRKPILLNSDEVRQNISTAALEVPTPRVRLQDCIADKKRVETIRNFHKEARELPPPHMEQLVATKGSALIAAREKSIGINKTYLTLFWVASLLGILVIPASFFAVVFFDLTANLSTTSTVLVYAGLIVGAVLWLLGARVLRKKAQVD